MLIQALIQCCANIHVTLDVNMMPQVSSDFCVILYIYHNFKILLPYAVNMDKTQVTNL